MPDSGFRRSLATVLLSLFPLLGVAPGAAQEWRDFRSARHADDLSSLEVHLLYAGGTLRIFPSEPALLYDARAVYDGERWRPSRDWRREGRDGSLRFVLSSRPDAEEDAEAPNDGDARDPELDLEDLGRGADDAGRLSFALSPTVPTRLQVGVGAGRTRLDLGGMTLTALEFATGAGHVQIDFSRENRAPMELLSMKSGATGLVAENLGNAHFERMEFLGVVGAVTLDFSGAWRSSAEAEITMALGELVLRVPREIGVRLRRSGLSSLSAEGFREADDDTYLSPNWASAAVRLDITVAAGLGGVTVERG